MTKEQIRNIEFNNQTFTIRKGTTGVYEIEKIDNVEIVYEKGKIPDIENPFKKVFRERDLQLCTWGSGFVLVGLCITLRDDIVYLYVSNKGNQWQSLQFYKDVKEAKKIMDKLKGNKS